MIGIPPVKTVEEVEICHVLPNAIGIVLHCKDEEEIKQIYGLPKSVVLSLHESLSELIASDFKG